MSTASAAIPPPTQDELRAAARELHFELDDSELATFAGLMQGLVGDLNLVELAHSNVLIDSQRARTLGLRSEVLGDKIKEPIRQCPKLSLGDLGLAPPPPPFGEPADLGTDAQRGLARRTCEPAGHNLPSGSLA